MASPRPITQPTFLWQAVLILLPVLALAVVSFWLLRQDRAAVEREARERAAEIMARLAAELPVQISQQLAAAKRQEVLTQAALLRDALRPALTNVSSADTIASPPVLRPDLIWSSAGMLLRPDERYVNPQPPTWLLALNGEQRAAWNAFKAVSGQGGEGPPALAQFLATAPPDHARAAAKYHRLRMASDAHPSAENLAAWLRFAERCGGRLTAEGDYLPSTNEWADATSEAGLPLSSLALWAALRMAPAATVNPDHWPALVREVWFHPSLLSERLLEVVGKPAPMPNPYQPAVAALRQHNQREGELLLLAATIAAAPQIQNGSTESFWVESQPDSWLVVLENLMTNESPAMAFPAGTPHKAAFLFSEALIASALSNAVAAIPSWNLPPYLRLRAELTGRMVPLPERWGTAFTNTVEAVVFAQAENHFSPLGTEAKPPASTLGMRVDLRLALVLTEPAVMYAAQRQRMWFSWALVGAAALAALIGLMAAWRSFHRQLRLNEMKSNFVSSVSHELRAPIASVRLMAESLERGKISGPEKQHEYFRFIGQECRRLSALIENVLDFSRIEQGRKEYEFEPTDLAALTRETVKLMEPYAAEKGVRLRAECDVPNAERNVDGRALQQALVNLMDNAIKHSPKDATVTVRLALTPTSANLVPSQNPHLTPDPSHLTLSVTDTGPGIPAAEHEKIFERFYRLGSELRRETQGIGIGLSIVQHIVTAHGGRVRVESEVGHGSRFTIELAGREVK